VTVVVSDTSPLNYLILCGVIDVLPPLFQKVVVPPAVLTELRSRDAPSIVRTWTDALPRRVEAQSPSHRDPTLALHSGECEAICLAIEIHADFVLVDDRAARKAATELGLCVVGTLGVLERAAATNLLSLSTVLDALGQTTFKIAPALIAALRERDAQRRR
jgi:predicted nucleic acid-binding protein